MLVGVRKRCPYELEADFQEFYNLDIERMSYDYSVRHAANLTVQLPPRSRVRIALDPEAQWHWSEHQMADVIDRLNILIWQQTKSGSKGKNAPDPVPRPHKKVEKTKEEVAMTSDRYKQILARSRKEVEHV